MQTTCADSTACTAAARETAQNLPEKGAERDSGGCVCPAPDLLRLVGFEVDHNIHRYKPTLHSNLKHFQSEIYSYKNAHLLTAGFSSSDVTFENHCPTLSLIFVKTQQQMKGLLLSSPKLLKVDFILLFIFFLPNSCLPFDMTEIAEFIGL